MKKIGIIGSGMVAKTLGSGFIKHGYDVMLGTRDSEKLKQWQMLEGKGSKIGNFNDTANFGDLIILAVKGLVAKAVLQSIGKENLSGKTIIDATNPIVDAAPQNGVLKFFTTSDHSLMEQLQEALPKSNFVKAFNSVGSAIMVNPEFSLTPTMFICGNNAESKKEATDILTKFGWETQDMGHAEAARAIEPLCMLWCIPGFLNNEWTHAFKLLKK